MTDDLTLAAREGWPEHLRILADLYPRETWETHHNFDGLTRFWLERHLGFRQMHAALNADIESLLDKAEDPMRFAPRMARLAGTMIEHLHGHHQIEDLHYFPLLLAKEKRLLRGFEVLDKDHHAIDGTLADLTTHANALLRDIGERHDHAINADKYLQSLSRFGRFLDRHLTDEEEIVVPIILLHGGPQA
jgi:iron-sulfur cluster repair protein YtfE (RIC family)